MNFTKISHNPKEVRTRLEWSDAEGNEKTLVSRQSPHPDLLAALQAFVPVVVDACMLATDYEPLTVRGLTMKPLEDSLGLTVTALCGLDWTETPLVVNTPFAPIGLIPTIDLEEKLDMLIREALAFLDGKRAQRGLFEVEEEVEMAGA